MIFKNLFKPRWQHSNPQIRRQALDELTDDYGVLTEIVRRDPDPELRILAIGRHTDLTILDLSARTDADPRVQESAASRLCEILAGTIKGVSLSERLAWIGRSADPALLAYIVRHGVESNLRSAVLERITDSEVLAATAVADLDARVRAAAAMRLQDRILLERVSKLSRNRDKGVHRIVQERLTTLLEEEERPRRQRLLREGLCADVEALVRRGHWRDAATPLGRLENRWAAAEGVADSDVAERFVAAVAVVRRGLADEEERQREQARLDEEMAVIRDKKLSLCCMIENLTTDLAGRGQLSHEDAALAHTLLRTAESGWAESGSLPEREETALNARFQGAGTDIRARLGDLLRSAEQLATRRAQCNRVEQALAGKQTPEERTLKEWSREWQALPASTDDPEETALTERFQTAMQQLRERNRTEQENRSQSYANAEAAVTELEHHLEQGSVKAAASALNLAKSLLGNLPVDARSGALKTRMEHGATEVHKLLEWQRWSNIRERERLCAEVEALQGVQEEPERLAAEIRGMRETWNRLGPLERDSSAIGERFNAACEIAFEPCRIYFAEQASQREEAAKQREAVIARIEAFTTNADWKDMDWKAADRFLLEVRDAWRNTGAVDRRTLENLQGHFTAALEPLQREVRNYHRNILKAKEDLVARAVTAQKSPDLRTATNEIKQIQIEWKALGYAPRRQEQVLWRRLRVAADDVFERRHAEVLAQEAERTAARTARETLCEKLEHLTQRIGTDLAATQSEFVALEQQWATAPTAPREDAATLDNRFRKACTSYHEAVAEFRRQQTWRVMEVLATRSSLCTELEALAESDGDEHRSAVETASDRWRTLGGGIYPALAARFERACANASLPRTERTALEPPDAEALETLFVRLEILAEVESPPESARMRLSHQMDRLATGFGRGQGTITTKQRHTQFMDLLRTYYATGSISAELRTTLESRLGRVLGAVKEAFPTLEDGASQPPG